MLSKKEKKLIKEIWERLTPVAADIGSDALLRMFASYPGTKTYFSHLDISPGSAHLSSHGKKIVLAIAEGAKDISQLTVTLAPLQTLHAYQLRIDPTNFKLLCCPGSAPVFIRCSSLSRPPAAALSLYARHAGLLPGVRVHAGRSRCDG
ncbi:PREDICTED: hemoglobin subunit alpha-D-like isoform X2 [Poecilia mexicana]|uniref:hemoglobin subunit alpha-D-like isoform X2 n=1 Tax=Poecilia mexicana TaxID=48701 RepID=UPI00072ED662|nr:PREDICTED: hemoglobin subunit alpha-D-like isoform X2 [Poecilia mexicana]XP_016522802.1 PREDICTED: hemoglobin subunit alpha-D-like isoform X2 [Poecilia formosa]